MQKITQHYQTKFMTSEDNKRCKGILQENFSVSDSVEEEFKNN